MSHLMQLFEASRFPGGVEVQTDGISATMTLDGPEHGSLRLFSLSPGVILSFNRIYTQVWPLAQTEAANILLLNFCLNGRCEVDLDNGQFAFLSQGIMALGTQQVKEAYRYPSGVYEGVELFLDLDALELEPYSLFQETGIDLSALIRHFQAAQKLYLAQTPAAIQGILSELWALRDTEDVGRMKLNSARLLLELGRQPYVPHPRIRYFTLVSRSSPLKGSSRNSRSYSASRARRMATRRRIPPDNSLTGWCRQSVRPTAVRASSAADWLKVGVTSRRLDTRFRFSHSRSSWNTALRRRPCNPVMVPRSGVSSPIRIRRRVVLPAPEGAISPVTCPAGRTAEKSRRTCFPSKALLRPRITISCMAHILSKARSPHFNRARKTFSNTRLTSTITSVQANRSGVFR